MIRQFRSRVFVGVHSKSLYQIANCNCDGTRHKPEFWRDMALKKVKNRSKIDTGVADVADSANKATLKEIIKEKKS